MGDIRLSDLVVGEVLTFGGCNVYLTVINSSGQKCVIMDRAFIKRGESVYPFDRSMKIVEGAGATYVGGNYPTFEVAADYRFPFDDKYNPYTEDLFNQVRSFFSGRQLSDADVRLLLDPVSFNVLTQNKPFTKAFKDFMEREISPYEGSWNGASSDEANFKNVIGQLCGFQYAEYLSGLRSDGRLQLEIQNDSTVDGYCVLLDGKPVGDLLPNTRDIGVNKNRQSSALNRLMG